MVSLSFVRVFVAAQEWTLSRTKMEAGKYICSLLQNIKGQRALQTKGWKKGSR